MKFDATATQGLAALGEKHEMPACLPLVSSTGVEGAIMHYEFTCAEAMFSLKPVPTVFIKTPRLPGIHSYLASQFLEAAAEHEGFAISGGFDDQIASMVIDASEIQQFAHWLRSKVERRDGRFVTLWVPHDPALPF